MDKQTKKLAVLVSGSGSILKAMIEEKLPIELVVADRECPGIEIAKKAGIKTVVMPRVFGKVFDREAYTIETAKVLQDHGITLVAMAGYMTVFHAVMFSHYENTILNIHPSLLPSFKGDHAVRDALAFGAKVTGTTVHVATPALDDGKILAQKAVDVVEGESEEELHERIKTVERKLYPEVVRKLLAE